VSGPDELAPFDLGSPDDPELLRLALVELERVHRAELARLLREAARAGLGLRGQSPEALRVAFSEALRCAEADRLPLPSAVLGPIRRWLAHRSVEPGELARASLRLEASFEGRRLLARVRLAGRELA
jgi:hypothetical protein